MCSSRLIPALAALFALAWVSSAQATFPGGNGRIALSFDTGCIGTVPPSGAGLRGVGPCGGAPASGGVDWSPDGKRLLFARAGAIWMMRADGSNAHPVPLAARPHFDTVAAPPSFAPDGRHFAYTRERAGGRAGESEIWVAASDGSDDRRLRAGSAPAWSPDGRSIAYMAPARHGRTPLRVMDVATGRAVSQIARDGRSVDWSPDGRRLVFEARTVTLPYEAVIGVGDPAGKRQPRIVVRDAHAPVWSPNGREIAFIRQQQAGAGRRSWVVLRERPRVAPRRLFASEPSLLEDAVPRPADLAWQPLAPGPRGGACGRGQRRCVGRVAPGQGAVGLGTAVR